MQPEVLYPWSEQSLALEYSLGANRSSKLVTNSTDWGNGERGTGPKNAQLFRLQTSELAWSLVAKPVQPAKETRTVSSWTKGKIEIGKKNSKVEGKKWSHSTGQLTRSLNQVFQ